MLVLNAPESFEPELEAMASVTEVKRHMKGVKAIPFFLGFATTQKTVDEIALKILPLLEEDGLIWIAYPKGTSKKYSCDFNRDTGWTLFGEAGFEPVRMVAVDADWSALRFRRATLIKTMTRASAISKEGKERVAASKSKPRK